MYLLSVFKYITNKNVSGIVTSKYFSIVYIYFTHWSTPFVPISSIDLMDYKDGLIPSLLISSGLHTDGYGINQHHNDISSGNL